MLVKGLALVIATATATGPLVGGVGHNAGAAGGGFRASPMGQFRASANNSRSTYVPGERQGLHAIGGSSGSLSLGDTAYFKAGSGAVPIEDLLLAAVSFLQVNETKLDREVQEIVSANFETYWD